MDAVRERSPLKDGEPTTDENTTKRIPIRRPLRDEQNIVDLQISPGVQEGNASVEDVKIKLAAGDWSADEKMEYESELDRNLRVNRPPRTYEDSHFLRQKLNITEVHQNENIPKKGKSGIFLDSETQIIREKNSKTT